MEDFNAKSEFKTLRALQYDPHRNDTRREDKGENSPENKLGRRATILQANNS